MADQVLTKQKLINADEDLGDLEEVLNGPPGKLVKTRLGRQVYTLASVPQINTMTREEVNAVVAPKANKADVDTALSNLSTAASKYYSTLAEANQYISSIGVNQLVYIGSYDGNEGLYYRASPEATSLTKSAYDPLTQAKAYSDANPLFKPIQVKVGDDANNFTKPGIYYLWGVQIPEGSLLNWPVYVGGNASPGVLIVRNPIAVDSNGIYQEFYSYYDGYRATYTRKRSQSGVFLPWENYITSFNQHKLKMLATEGLDVLTLAPGIYGWTSVALGNSFLNMPSVPYKFGRLEIKENANGSGLYKVAIFYPYGRDKNFYMNTNYESNVWNGWKTYKDSETLEAAIAAAYSSKSETASLISSAVNSAVESISGSEYFGKNYTDPEMKGNSFYTQAYYAGYNQTTGSKGIVFNSIEALIYNPSGTEIEWRLYTGNKCAVGQYGNTVLAANALLPDASGFIDDFPTIATEPVKIKLNKVISIPANTPFVLVFRNAGLTTLRIGCFFPSNPEAMPDRGFSMWAQAQEWGEFSIAATSPLSGYRQTGFKLKLENSGSGTTPQPVEKHKPIVVMPPKIYIIRGLQAHIYPEHLLFERPSLYDHDIVCTKGKQMERGWVWDHNPDAPDPFGVVGLTWNIHDVETTELLSGGTTNLNFVDPNNKNGQNLKVCVIGDSLVNAAAMTARLLAIAETDVTKVNLIGTRGTGLNLHEGRGGWTINDYAGTGRTYYKFDVSGVTTIPAINSATYLIDNTELLVQEVNISSGTGSIICSLNKGAAPTIGVSGVLNKSNASAGDSSIAYSNVQTVSGNPFWNATTSSVDFAGYLSRYSLESPDVVFIQLGVNDTFGLTSDQAVIDFCGTAFPKLDTLINSIKAANPSVKIVVMTPPVYANQDAFGTNYACNQNAWRAKRNIVGFNKLLISNYSNKEANSIYLLGSGVNVDTVNNFPTEVTKINSHNQNNITIQVNGVHPDVPGYYQIGDAMWACLKAI